MAKQRIVARIWNGHAELGTGSLTWQDDAILAVDTASGAPDATGAEPEFSVIPGLVDTHVHLAGYAGSGSVDFMSWPLITPDTERVLHVVSNAQRAMRAGVTTLRDLGADGLQLSASRAFDAGIVEGPRIVGHGQVGMTAGHGDLFTPPHFPQRIPLADSPGECRKLVREWARIGMHGIKIHTSGGVLSMGDRVGWRGQTVAEIAATVDEAHALGMRVAAHTHTLEGARVALGEGVDSIEHGTGLREETWSALLERNVSVAPTLMINDALAQARVPVSPEQQEKALEVVAERDANFGGAAAAGVRFVLGTDANGAMVQFGDQLEETRMMRDTFGWTSERALQAATSDAADVVGLGAKVGTLAPGYGADFLVVRGRPWVDVAELTPDRIVAVVARGRVVAGALPA